MSAAFALATLSDIVGTGVAFTLNVLIVALSRPFAVFAGTRTTARTARLFPENFPVEGSMHEHNAGAVDREVGLEPVTVVRVAEVIDGSAHGSLVMIGVCNHGHEPGPAQSRPESDDKAVWHPLSVVEYLGGKRLAAHRHHHVGQDHLEWERNHRPAICIIKNLSVGSPALPIRVLGGCRDSRLGEKTLNIPFVDLPIHEFHRLVE